MGLGGRRLHSLPLATSSLSLACTTHGHPQPALLSVCSLHYYCLTALFLSVYSLHYSCLPAVCTNPVYLQPALILSVCLQPALLMSVDSLHFFLFPPELLRSVYGLLYMSACSPLTVSTILIGVHSQSYL